MLLLDFKIDRQFLQSHKLSFSIPANSPKIYHLEEDRTLEFDDEFYFISKKVARRSRNELYYDIEASAAWYRLGERGYEGNFTISAVTPQRGLELILEAAAVDGFVWQIGLISSSMLYYSMDAKDATYLDLLRQWAKICDCELTFDTKRNLVHMKETIGGNFGISFRYQRNLDEIEREVIPPAITRLYPYGRSGLTIAGQNGGITYLEDYTYYTGQGLTLPQAQAAYRKDYYLQDDSFVDDVSLYQWAVSKLAVLAQPIVNYQVKVSDLSDITGYAESRFELDDFVVVEDEPLGIAVIARVVRHVRYPYEPERNEVELSTAPVSLPDPNIQTSRDNAKNWELFVARNYNTPREVGVGVTLLHKLPLIVTADTEWIITYSIRATCETSGTLQIRFTDDLSGQPFLSTLTIPCTAGEEIVRTVSFASEQVLVNSYNFMVRAEMLGASGLVTIDADDTNLWVHARNVIQGQNPAYNTSVRYEYTGAVQYFRVPDDVSEIQVEAQGAAAGGMVSAKFSVIAGDTYSVYVGGTAGWPNGGVGGYAPLSSGGPGGGSSHMIVPGGSFDAIGVVICAAGGGGGNAAGPSRLNQSPGVGGFLRGTHGSGPSVGSTIDNPDSYGYGGCGATQSAGGAGGNTPLGGGSFGNPGTFGQGGNGPSTGNNFAFGGGGGGGGWYGGGGAANEVLYGGGYYCGDGGGGSGYCNPNGYDLDYLDGANSRGSNGYIEISWADPNVP